MREYRTLRAALAAIDRGMIVDVDDNHVPARVADMLRARAWSNHRLCKLHFKAGIRYAGGREVWWFSE